MRFDHLAHPTSSPLLETGCRPLQSFAGPWLQIQPQLRPWIRHLGTVNGRHKSGPERTGQPKRPVCSKASCEWAKCLRRSAIEIPQERTRGIGARSRCKTRWIPGLFRGLLNCSGKGPDPQSLCWLSHRFLDRLRPWPQACVHPGWRRWAVPIHLTCSHFAFRSGQTRGWVRRLQRPFRSREQRCLISTLLLRVRGHRLRGFLHR